ncbi:MAG: NusG domain II-containing protein [Eubacterium sp.]|nr:NusG domain II-containing protein [Eubacterium sp.]
MKTRIDRTASRTGGFIGKSDVCLIAAIAVFSAFMLFFYLYSAAHVKRPMLNITVENQEYGTYDLAEDRVIEINDTNICEIAGGQVRMLSADCPDQICIKSKAIDRNGGSIVCLPNRVVLRIIDAAESNAPDSIAG